MKHFTTALLLAGSGCATARWLRWSGDTEPTQIPRETGAVPVAGQGWTPKPTPGPGARRSNQDLVVEYLERRQGSANSPSRNTWTNEQTCGWFKGTSSSAFTCGEDFSCATNEDHNVACASGTYSPFFTVCLDHDAFLDGACDDAQSLTGCCQDSKSPACGTYIWTGSPTRSMYRCFESTQIISLLDLPQFVIDASISSSIAASKSSESERLKSLTASKASSLDAGGDPAVTTADDPAGQPTSGSGENAGADDGEGNGGDTTNNTTNNGDSTSNTPAIVGGALGGLAALILICLLLFCLMRRKRKSKKNGSKKKTKKTTVTNTVTSNQNSSDGRKSSKGLLSRAWHAISGAGKGSRKNAHAPATNPEKLSSDTSRSHTDAAPWPLVPATTHDATRTAPPPAVYDSGRGQPSHSTSQHPSTINTFPTDAGLHDPSIATSNYAIQQKLKQKQRQPSQMTYDNPIPTAYPHLQQDVTSGSSSTNIRSQSDAGGTTGDEYPTSQAQAHAQKSAISANIADRGVSTTGGGGHDAAHPGSMAFYHLQQQPQHMGDGPPLQSQPHNFTFVLNHYTNGPTTTSSNGQGAATRDVQGPLPRPGSTTSETLQPQFTGRSSVATGRLRPQATGDSGMARGLSMSTTGSRRGRGVASADTAGPDLDYVSSKGAASNQTATNSNAYPGPRRAESTDSWGNNKRPPSSSQRTSRARESTGTTTSAGLSSLGAEASAIAMAGLSLDVNNNNTPQQQQYHHHHHHYPNTASDDSRKMARNARYTDGSTMTTPPTTSSGTGTGVQDDDAAAGYRNRQVSGNGAAQMGFSVDVNFESEVTHADDCGLWIQQQGSGTSHQSSWKQRSQHFTGSSSNGTSPTPLDTGGRGVGDEGKTQGRGLGQGQGPAWYRRPVGMESDEPVELEASPAPRKVD